MRKETLRSIRSSSRARTSERGFALIAAIALSVLYFALMELMLIDSSRELAEARRFRARIVAIFAILTSEMRAHQKRLPINFMRHPQISAVVSRMRRDVQDGFGSDPYKPNFDGYSMAEDKVIIVETVQPNGGVQTIIWDLREDGVARRRAYNVGLVTEWIARGLPAIFDIDAVDIPGRPYGVRFTATDSEGRLAIDQILQPRGHN